MANSLEYSPSILRRCVGIGAFILVPVGFPFSSINTTLLESKRGVIRAPGILWPTMRAFFFCPLMASKTLSPTLPIPFLVYTWMTFGGRWWWAFPRALLSTTLTRVNFWIAATAAELLQWDDNMMVFVKNMQDHWTVRATWSVNIQTKTDLNKWFYICFLNHSYIMLMCWYEQYIS